MGGAKSEESGRKKLLTGKKKEFGLRTRDIIFGIRIGTQQWGVVYLEGGRGRGTSVD